ncbi:hypothetical protein GCM10010172_38450 [Paractinoplanes ferrugineus]|uniref:Methyltransferase domain-containing protein n=1 Tax=Paractinoplanes ferrugineus TaxID=113564 RepID=A0A919J8Q7_9ACTN|nr:hypothetical protein [Actinoplanes ferrugineus]GIE12621.1 hypothetical protein Afe05nite_44610 [Actinoplanes ferrugineus]
MPDERRYRETTGATKTFTHPLIMHWLAGLERDARILDYGCGHGRLMEALVDRKVLFFRDHEAATARLDPARRDPASSAATWPSVAVAAATRGTARWSPSSPRWSTD